MRNDIHWTNQKQNKPWSVGEARWLRVSQLDVHPPVGILHSRDCRFDHNMTQAQWEKGIMESQMPATSQEEALKFLLTWKYFYLQSTSRHAFWPALQAVKPFACHTSPFLSISSLHAGLILCYTWILLQLLQKRNSNHLRSFVCELQQPWLQHRTS